MVLGRVSMRKSGSEGSMVKGFSGKDVMKVGSGVKGSTQNNGGSEA